ncbi:hypothetical protein LIT38_17925 [Bacillus sp. CMF12]|uniref:hypothetical protein n=1 Tax=Bacillaceae TaxID=186817 RepID=UPI001FB3A028|nr:MULTISPECIES: hypothetical protein [Bacillaceae]UOE53968.1 hypothetical protein IRB79_19325 [Cytobacillus oceanisediminis]USK48418.1 hypothetical protein LIT38_17925 [Bacillus sp. CMF12]
MKTINVELQYDDQEMNNNQTKVFNQLKNQLEGTGFKVVTIMENDLYLKEHSGLPNQKKNKVLPSQPEGAEPDINSSGAGGMVSPDSSESKYTE